MQTWRRLSLALALALASALIGNTSAWAEQHGTRVAVIEMARVLEEASAIHSIRSQGEAQRNSYAEEAQRESVRAAGYP